MQWFKDVGKAASDPGNWGEWFNQHAQNYVDDKILGIPTPGEQTRKNLQEAFPGTNAWEQLGGAGSTPATIQTAKTAEKNTRTQTAASKRNVDKTNATTIRTKEIDAFTAAVTAAIQSGDQDMLNDVPRILRNAGIEIGKPDKNNVISYTAAANLTKRQELELQKLTYENLKLITETSNIQYDTVKKIIEGQVLSWESHSRKIAAQYAAQLQRSQIWKNFTGDKSPNLGLALYGMEALFHNLYPGDSQIKDHFVKLHKDLDNVSTRMENAKTDAEAVKIFADYVFGSEGLQDWMHEKDIKPGGFLQHLIEKLVEPGRNIPPFDDVSP